MRYNDGRRQIASVAIENDLVDPKARFDSWSIFAAPGRVGADGSVLPSVIRSNSPGELTGGVPTHIYGTTGDDVLAGTSLDDVIEDAWGDDVIDGGDGDDRITDGGGNNVLRGGTGNDFIRLAPGNGSSAFIIIIRTNSIDAGSGDDDVRIEDGRHQRLTIDLGTGNDRLTISQAILIDNQVSVTTGTGADRIVLDRVYGDALRGTLSSTLVVSDFTAGAGGDILDLGGLIQGLLAFTKVAANPFSDGHLHLIQDGADTIVRVDIDGYGPGTTGYYVRDVARLLNVSAAALTAYNLAGYNPGGGASLHDVVNGTAGGDLLQGSIGGSDIFGGDGDDRIYGGIGADRLEGGAGNDVIEGGSGDDILRGGDGDDILTDGYGSDVFEGGAGNDLIAVVRPALPYGVPIPSESVRIDAGDGDDFVSFSGRNAGLIVDLGAGNDRIEFPKIVPNTYLTLGAGQDRVVFGQSYLPSGSASLPPLVIADFAAGNGGDVLEVDRVILISQGWNGVTNPFANGYLSLQQSGPDTLVIWDYDGNGAGTERYTITRLAGVNAANLTAFNFGGYAPDGSASPYTVANGTPGDDHLYGSNGNDLINGGAGNDRIEELKNGSDTLNGGDGDDTITVNHVTSTPTETVTIDAGNDNDQVFVTGRYVQLNIGLGAGNDRLTFAASGQNGSFVTLGAGADVIIFDSLLTSTTRGPLTITDFETGNGGDKFDWNLFAESKMLNFPWGYQHSTFDLSAYNPFLVDDARLIQSGADTLLQINSQAGTSLPASYETLLTFQNTNVASFTAYNVGYEPYVPTQSGGAGDDTFTGTGGVDVLVGNGGNDHLDGLGGNDVLRGYDGVDTLTGGAGNDRIEGGKGEDVLSGGDDDDWLDGGYGRDVVDGGNGNDNIFDLNGHDVISGGAGNDTINLFGYDDYGSTNTAPGSVDAGDGNDVVYVDNPNSLEHLTVDLGTGDDIVHIVSPIQLLTLGAGTDTIFYAPPNRASPVLVIADFAAGAGGDVFDLKTFLNGPLNFNQTKHLVEDLGFDPFALGVVELRQNGSDVELFVYPDGTNDDAIYGAHPVVRFLNTNVAQFTAANFAGQGDPHATPNHATLIQGDLTVSAGQTLDALNVAPIQVVQLAAASTHFLFRNDAATANFVNHGTITSRLTELGFGGLAGIVVDNGMSRGGSFVNAADGHFTVDLAFSDTNGGVSAGSVYGFYAGGRSVSFRNDGDFAVHAASGTATGVVSGYDTTSSPVTNTGTFVVTSNYDAIGFQLGQFTNFTNSGHIRVSGNDFALGFWLTNYRDGEFNNSGDITITTSLKSPYYSVGVLIYHDLAGTYNLYNAGSITAEIAFYSDDGNTQFIGNQDVLHNSGTINGAIFLGAGNDSLINDGTVSGVVSLGDGFDLYDGRNGILNGYVLGDGGDDTLYGGAGSDDLSGGDGSDHLLGGDGADILEGDAGGDILEGGSGADRFFYAQESDSQAAAPDRILGFQTGIDKIDLSALDVDSVSWTSQTDPSIGPYYLVDIQTASGAMTIRVAGNGLASSDFIRLIDPPQTITGTSGNDVLAGGSGADSFFLQQGGDDNVSGGDGNDGFFFGAAFTATDHVDGGASNNDQIGLQGDYSGANALVLGANTIVNVEAIVVLPGFSYTITTVDGNVAAGGVLKIQATQLTAGQSLTLNGAAETDGSFIVYGGQGNDTITGGAGNDGFYFGPGGFTGADLINGGAGINDQLALDGDYALTLGANVTNVEVLVLLHGPSGTPNHFNITSGDVFVGAGATKIIFGVQVETAITFDGSGEHDGAFRIYGGTGNDTFTGSDGNDWIFGGYGGDAMTGGAGADTFFYDDVSQSTSPGFDRLVGFDANVDRIDLPFIVGTFAVSISGTLNSASMDMTFASTFGGLPYHQAAQFTATGGDMAGRTFLVVDADGNAGYQAGSDYVIEIVSPPTPVDNPAIFI